LAVFVTAAHFLVLSGYRPIERRVLSARAELRVRHAPGKGAVEKIMQILYRTRGSDSGAGG
jgi:hypothetical protein